MVMVRYANNRNIDTQLIVSIAAVFCVCLSNLSYAQGYFFSQYKATPLMVSPALAGYEDNIYFGINYRLQNQAEISYQTAQFAAILPLYVQGQERDHLGGMGISAVSDVAGEFNEVKTYGLSFASAYNMQLDQYDIQMITFGLQVSYTQMGIDFGKLNWPSQITYKGFDHSVVPSEQYSDQINYVAFNAGAMWSYDSRNKRRSVHNDYRLQLGVSVANLNQPDQSLIAGQVNNLPMLYKAHGGGIFELNEDVRIAPDFLVMMQNQNFQYNIGTSLSYATAGKSGTKFENTGISMRLGTWYRIQDSFVFLIGASNENFDAAVSYDINASADRADIRNQGALELSVAFKIQRDNSLKKIETPLY